MTGQRVWALPPSAKDVQGLENSVALQETQQAEVVNADGSSTPAPEAAVAEGSLDTLAAEQAEAAGKPDVSEYAKWMDKDHGTEHS